MPSIRDDRGFNQGFKPSKALEIRTERRCDYIVSQMANRDDIDILEIGCGTGELADLLAKKTGQRVIGADLCARFIEEAREKYSRDNLQFEVLDFNDVAGSELFRDKKFDYVVGNGILHHLYYNIEAALENLNSLLKEGGRIIFLEPNVLNPYCLFIFRTGVGRRLAKLEPAEMAFAKKFISEKLAGNNFSVSSVCYRDFLLPVTPGFLIRPVILLGGVLEKLPLVSRLSQSIFITAERRGAQPAAHSARTK